MSDNIEVELPLLPKGPEDNVPRVSKIISLEYI